MRGTRNGNGGAFLPAQTNYCILAPPHSAKLSTVFAGNNGTRLAIVKRQGRTGVTMPHLRWLCVESACLDLLSPSLATCLAA